MNAQIPYAAAINATTATNPIAKLTTWNNNQVKNDPTSMLGTYLVWEVKRPRLERRLPQSAFANINTTTAR